MKFLTLLTTLLITAPTLISAASYPVKADVLNCRKTASTTAAVVKTYKKGALITIKCQTTGPNVSGTTIWDKTQDDCYVSDYYVKTGYSSYVPGISKCTSSSNPPSSGTSCISVNAKTIALIKEFEGFVPRPAPDPVGLPTVGYGHLCKTKSCSEAGKFPLTVATATELLKKDVKIFTSCVAKHINDSVKLNDNQFGALVSWAFNVGCENVRTSTLLKKLNGGQNPTTAVEQELPKWNKAGSPLKVLPGLTRRRKAEIALFKTASSKQAHPKCA